MSVEAGAILRCVAELIMPGSTVAQNVYYATFNDTGGSNADQDVVDDVGAWLNSLYNELRHEMTSATTAGQVKVYIWDDVGLDWDELGSFTMTFVNDGAGEMLPHGVAAVITARTFDPDVNGRKFFAAFSEASQSESSLVGSALLALLEAAEIWVTTFTGTATGSTFYPGVWSVVGLIFRRMVDHYIINGTMGYQRRRKPGVGI